MSSDDIYSALLSGDYETAELYLSCLSPKSYKARSNVRSQYHNLSLLIHAIRQSAPRNLIIKLISLESGFQEKSRGWTALFEAISKKSEFVEELIRLEKHLKAKKGVTPLMYAASVDYFIAVKNLQEQIGDTDESGNTALMYAAMKNSTTSTAFLIPSENGKVNKNGKTALMYAAETGSVEALELLISYEARKRNINGHSALFYAIVNKQWQCVRILAKYEYDIVDHKGKTALMLATECLDSDPECFALLLTYLSGKRTEDGTSALITAVESMNIAAIQALLPYEAGFTDINGWTALMHAVYKEDIEILRILSSNPKETRKYDNQGYSALMHAVYINSIPSVKELVRYENCMISPKSFTALICACKWGKSIEIIDVLSKYELQVHNEDQLPAIAYALHADNMEAVSLLASKGEIIISKNMLRTLAKSLESETYLFLNNLRKLELKKNKKRNRKISSNNMIKDINTLNLLGAASQTLRTTFSFNASLNNNNGNNNKYISSVKPKDSLRQSADNTSCYHASNDGRMTLRSEHYTKKFGDYETVAMNAPTAVVSHMSTKQEKSQFVPFSANNKSIEQTAKKSSGSSIYIDATSPRRTRQTFFLNLKDDPRATKPRNQRSTIISGRISSTLASQVNTYQNSATESSISDEPDININYSDHNDGVGTDIKYIGSNPMIASACTQNFVKNRELVNCSDSIKSENTSFALKTGKSGHKACYDQSSISDISSKPISISSSVQISFIATGGSYEKKAQAYRKEQTIITEEVKEKEDSIDSVIFTVPLASPKQSNNISNNAMTDLTETTKQKVRIFSAAFANTQRKMIKALTPENNKIWEVIIILNVLTTILLFAFLYLTFFGNPNFFFTGKKEQQGHGISNHYVFFLLFTGLKAKLALCVTIVVIYITARLWKLAKVPNLRK